MLVRSCPSSSRGKDSPLIFRQCQGFLVVFGLQNLLVSVGDLGWYTLEECVSEGEDVCVLKQSAVSQSNLPDSVTYLVLMAILAAQYPLPSGMRVVVPRCRDIDKQATRRIHPTRIDHIQLVRLFAVHVMRIDLEHVIATVRDARGLVVEDGHVVV